MFAYAGEPLVGRDKHTAIMAAITYRAVSKR